MYTLYKIASTAATAREIHASLDAPAVAVFWLEDNDHDAAEASTAHLATNDGIESVTAWDGTDPRRPVSSRNHTAGESETIASAIATLTGQYAEDVRQRYGAAYNDGAAWSDAFLAILQPYLAAWGVLVVRASDVIAQGYHAPILAHECASDATLSNALARGTQAIVDAGFEPQARPSDVALFARDAEGRQRITIDGTSVTLGSKTITRDAFDAELLASPSLFSPTVLSRPLVQDAVLPTVASVLGAAEIAYHGQLREAYERCGIPMPVPLLRHGATILDGRTERSLRKDQHDVMWYMRTREDFEHALTAAVADLGFPDHARIAAQVDDLVAPYVAAAQQTDTTLVATVHAQAAGIRATLEALEGKLRAAAKKANAASVERLRSTYRAVYPNGGLQERTYPLAMWEARLGIANMLVLVERITAEPLGSHSIVGVSDLPTVSTQ
jgi:bacillithiol biosynthesis cysteine-adding enzyme BshC